MEAATLRTPTSFQLDSSLLNSLKEKAKAISPELQIRINQARENYQKGNYVSCNTQEELHSLLDSL